MEAVTKEKISGLQSLFLSNLCFFIICNVLAKLSVVIIFILNMAPIVERTTFGLYGSALSDDNIICFKFALSAVLKIVPKLPGSCIPSNASIMSSL